MHCFGHLSRFFSVLSAPSVLNLFGSSLDRRSEESVGSLRGGAGPEESVRTNEIFDSDAFAQNSLERASRRDDAECSLRAAKRFIHDELVFFGLERTRRIDQPSVWREIRKCIL